jgi:hypothetical protein
VAFIGRSPIDSEFYFNSTTGRYRYYFSGSWSDLTPSGSSGNVTGPVSSTVNAIATWANIGGTLLQDSVVLVSGSSVSAESNLVADGTAANNLIVSSGFKTAGTGNGGNLSLVAGDSFGGLGGNVSISAGTTGDLSSKGSSVTITAGTSQNGDGGDVVFSGGTNTGGAGLGGNVVLKGGVGSGTNYPGYIQGMAGSTQILKLAYFNGNPSDTILVGALAGQTISAFGNVGPIAIGYRSMRNALSRNVAVGHRTLENASSSPYNTAIGNSAGNAISTGERNVFLGDNSGSSLSGGSGNTLLGENCFGLATSGDYNVAVGSQAGLRFGSGSGNIIIGYQASQFITAGSYNLMIGFLAGQILTSGSYNIGLGSGAQFSSATASHEMSIDQVYDIYLGLGANKPSSSLMPFKIQATSVAAGETDGSAATASLTIAGSQGTGTGVGGDIVFKVAGSGSSGSTQNPLAEKLRVVAGGNVSVTPNLVFASDGTSDIGLSSSQRPRTLYLKTSLNLAGSVSGSFTQQAADTTASYSVKWPAAQGAAFSVLANDGSGNLSWSNGPSTATVNTTDATLTTLQTIATSTDTSMLVQAKIVARRTGGTSGAADDSAAYILTALVKNVAGTVTVNVLQTDYAAEDQVAWDATMNVSGTNVLIQVTGAANNSVTWKTTTTTQVA